jgi:3-phenylpropionate/cinnamic acid dioxygenase small subunit
MTLEEQVQWLVDRAQISELLHAFAQALDTKNWAGYADLYAEDGAIELPWVTIPRSEMVGSVERDLGGYHATHHMSANHQITIDGDTATSRSYFQATHVIDAADQSKWVGGGWYDNTYRRTEEGWKLTRARVTPVWRVGERPT